MSKALWHVLQVSDVLDLELASALAESVEVIAWEPRRAMLPGLVRTGAEDERPSSLSDMLDPETVFRVRALPLMRGFARAPFRWVARTGSTVTKRMLRQTPDPAASTLICTTPYFAEVAERWPGPVVYWLTDLIAEYGGADRDTVHALDRRMCRAATLVCPNSGRLARYLVDVAGCDSAKICITPNATRKANLLEAIPDGPAALPTRVEAIQRPVAGVIGNLAGNMDWPLLHARVQATPWLGWVFVGGTAMEIADPVDRKARAEVMEMENTEFVGRQPYGELAGYARSFDVAVLPYRRCEPTYSGSSTRFYEHLAACRPMLSTQGLEELTHKTEVLTLFDTAEQGLAALDRLRAQGFQDGLTDRMWNQSRDGTWSARAEAMQRGLRARL